MDGRGAPSSRRRKSDPYRVVPMGYDPDVPHGSPTAAILEQAWRHVTGHSYIDMQTSENVEVIKRVDDRALVAAIFCRGCGPDPAAGERLADIWKTPLGLLFVSELVLAHDALLPFEKLHEDAVLMWHPQLGAYSCDWTTRRGLDSGWRDRGWVEAPAGMKPLPRWRQQRSQIVRDLITEPDLDHPPLRVACTRHGRKLVDRDKLLAELAQRQGERRSGRPIGVALHEVEVIA